MTSAQSVQVARLMRQAGLRAKTVKKWRATTQSNHWLCSAENTLNRQRPPWRQPNRVWAGDTAVASGPTRAGCILRCSLICTTSAVIGWAIGPVA